MWIQSKHMEQNVFVNWIIHLNPPENVLTLMLFQTYMTVGHKRRISEGYPGESFQ